LLIGFVNARSWLADVRQHADPHLTCILVGNKCDLAEDVSGASPPQSTASDPQTGSTIRKMPQPNNQTVRRQVSTEEAELWAKEEGLLFVEASAKSGQNVQEAFEEACSDILRKVREGVFDDDRVCTVTYYASHILRYEF
jgi:Ras-related protein Rab-2A